MKKILAILLSAVMMLSLCVPMAAVAEKILDVEVEKVSGVLPGKTVEVKIFVESEPIWSAIDINLNFDPTVLAFKKFVLNQELKDQADNGEAQIYALNKENMESGSVIIDFATASTAGGYEGYYGGEYDYIGIAHFTVKEDAPIGVSGVSVRIGKLVNSEQEDIPCNTVDGFVEIVDCVHNWQENGRAEADCENGGFVSYICTVCKDEKTDLTEELGHDWDNGRVTLATQYEQGYTTYTCKRDSSHTRIADYVEALRPVEGVVDLVVESLPEAARGTDIQLKIFVESEPIWSAIDINLDFDPTVLAFKKFVLNQELKDQADNGEPQIYALNKENMESGSVIIDFATASTAGGYEGYYGGEYDYIGIAHFTVKKDAPVGATGIGVNVGKLVDAKMIDLPCRAIGSRFNIVCSHNWMETDRVAAECEKEGYVVYTCSECREEKAETIYQLGHDWDSGKVTAPTCEAGGYTTYTCKHNAAHTYVADNTEALGHEWKEASRIEATCSKTGSITYACEHDEKHTKTEEIAINPEAHDYQPVVTAPTCEEQGYTTYTCKHNAEHTYIADYTEPLGHSFDAWSWVKEPTETEDGSQKRECISGCGHTESRVIEKIKRGDLDDDDQITVSDALGTLRVSAKMSEFDDRRAFAADIDKDNRITVADALAILRVAAKIISNL